jgi:hypothetical protein
MYRYDEGEYVDKDEKCGEVGRLSVRIAPFVQNPRSPRLGDTWKSSGLKTVTAVPMINYITNTLAIPIQDVINNNHPSSAMVRGGGESGESTESSSESNYTSDK